MICELSVNSQAQLSFILSFSFIHPLTHTHTHVQNTQDQSQGQWLCPLPMFKDTIIDGLVKCNVSILKTAVPHTWYCLIPRQPLFFLERKKENKTNNNNTKKQTNKQTNMRFNSRSDVIWLVGSGCCFSTSLFNKIQLYSVTSGTGEKKNNNNSDTSCTATCSKLLLLPYFQWSLFSACCCLSLLLIAPLHYCRRTSGRSPLLGLHGQSAHHCAHVVTVETRLAKQPRERWSLILCCVILRSVSTSPALYPKEGFFWWNPCWRCSQIANRSATPLSGFWSLSPNTHRLLLCHSLRSCALHSSAAFPPSFPPRSLPSSCPCVIVGCW